MGHSGGCGCRGGSGGGHAAGFCGIKERRSHGTPPTWLLSLVLRMSVISPVGSSGRLGWCCEGLSRGSDVPPFQQLPF